MIITKIIITILKNSNKSHHHMPLEYTYQHEHAYFRCFILEFDDGLPASKGATEQVGSLQTLPGWNRVSKKAGKQVRNYVSK